MAMGKRRRRGRQPSMWVASSDLPRSAGHPFYERLNRVLDASGFDAFVEQQRAKFYADGVGRPSLAPGRYFRMLLLGYFEGLDSERAIAWRAADSLSLRQFLAVSLDAAPPDHSTVSRTRRRIDVETHLAVFTWVLQRAGRRGPGRGQDGRHRRDDAGSQCGASQHRTPGYGRGLRDVPVPTGGGFGHRHADARRVGPPGPQAPEEGVQRRLDASQGPGREDHEDEGRQDPPGAQGQPRRGPGDGRGGRRQCPGCGCRRHRHNARDAGHRRRAGRRGAAGGARHRGAGLRQGLPLQQTLVTLAALEIRSYVSEPDRGRRNWRGKHVARDAVYANRRRIRGARGKRLLRRRGERLERPNAHLYATGGMRRVHLRGHGNILKRLLLQVCGLNLGLLMRQLLGVGTPRGLQGRASTLVDALRLALRRFRSLVSRSAARRSENWTVPSWIRPMTPTHSHILSGLQEGSSATGC